MIRVSDQFDSGNIETVSIDETGEAAALRLRIKPDAHSALTDSQKPHMQWFHFRITGAKGRPLSWHIENAGEVSYTGGWTDYRVCVSYDAENWFRIDTTYEDGVLSAAYTPEADSVYFAYFAPYSLDRHARQVGAWQARGDVSLEVLGQSVDGRDLELLTVAGGEKPVWVFARQHPGESMAEWLVEGMMERLLDAADPLARALREKATFYVVPNMNPDGSTRGHLRTNAAGVNLNRAWKEPSAQTSPEVFHVLQKMDETGLVFALDVHGDEALPYNFIAGSDGVADLPAHVIEARHTFEAALERANPDFQTKIGYPTAPPGKGNLAMATNQLAHRFSALAMTLEQPFKDNANAPMPHEGWSPRRAKRLGHAQLDALAAVIDVL